MICMKCMKYQTFFKMSLIARLFLICIVLTVITTIYLEITNYKIALIQNLAFLTLFCSIVIKMMTTLLKSLLKSYQYIYDTYTIIPRRTDFELNMNNLIFSITSMIFIILTIIKHQYIYDYIKSYDGLTCFICFLNALILIIIIDTNKHKEENICNINLIQGLDYGTGMAYNYYYGYLRIILPSTGSLNKGLIEKIENIEDIHSINISVHKLFILIPSSSYIPPDLKEASYHWMESAMDLESEIRNRAGVKRRSYHNTIYKIYPNNQRLNCTPIYVIVEGATPLLTFYEVMKNIHHEENIYQKYCKEIMHKFYKKLKHLINTDPECADLCELIYYDDYDSNGVKVNVAQVILNRLYKIQEMNLKNNGI